MRVTVHRFAVAVVSLVSVAAVSLSSCTATLAGTAEPADTAAVEREVAAGKPCALLSPEQARHLNYREKGEFRPAEPDALVPPICTFNPRYDDLGMDLLDIGFSSNLSIDDYARGADPSDPRQSGGLTWKRYTDSVAGDSLCRFVTEVSRNSFVSVVSSNFSESSESCVQAEAALPYVASHLPGGEPAPVPKQAGPSPLESVRPCTLLKSAEELGYRAEGESDNSTLYETGAACEWVAQDGDRHKMLILTVVPGRPMPVPGPNSDPETVKASGQEWQLLKSDATFCQARHEFSPRSFVTFSVSTTEKSGPACDKAKQAVPLIAEKLPNP